MRKSLVATLVALVVGLSAAFAAFANPAQAATTRPVVLTDTGLLRGVGGGTVDNFLGVPYAAPPTGDLRWRAPQPAKPWPGVHEASAYGNRCPATASTNGPRSETEDCLYLNVHRPANLRPGERVPVFFWIHGGGFTNGSSNQYDGGLVANTKRVIVVTVNYRLGALGFLALPALTREAGQSGNYGLMDQQAALRWVQRNIGAFGGNPGQVTVGGESAGGISTCAHLTAPGSRGLFARAVIESGSCASQPAAQAETAGASFAQALGCTDATAAAQCMRGRTVAQMLDATAQVRAFPAAGGPVLPQDPGAAVRAGNFARVPVLVGANRDEGRSISGSFTIGWTKDQYEGLVRRQYPTKADAILARYPWPATSDTFTAAYLLGDIFTDSGFLGGIGGCPQRALNQALTRFTRTFVYEFAHRDGPGLSPQPAGYHWGAGHAAELPYLFPSFDNGTPVAPTFNTAEKRLSADMVNYWGSFIAAGQPAAAFSAPWPSYNGGKQALSLHAGGQSRLISDTQYTTEHNCDLWPAS
jgi:para-nitrobenzyl esterase